MQQSIANNTAGIMGDRPPDITVKILINNNNHEVSGGGGGIRTHGGLSPTPVFKTGAFDHSATPPGGAGRMRIGLARPAGI